MEISTPQHDGNGGRSHRQGIPERAQLTIGYHVGHPGRQMEPGLETGCVIATTKLAFTIAAHLPSFLEEHGSRAHRGRGRDELSDVCIAVGQLQRYKLRTAALDQEAERGAASNHACHYPRRIINSDPQHLVIWATARHGSRPNSTAHLLRGCWALGFAGPSNGGRLRSSLQARFHRCSRHLLQLVALGSSSESTICTILLGCTTRWHCPNRLSATPFKDHQSRSAGKDQRRACSILQLVMGT